MLFLFAPGSAPAALEISVGHRVRGCSCGFPVPTSLMCGCVQIYWNLMEFLILPWIPASSGMLVPVGLVFPGRKFQHCHPQEEMSALPSPGVNFSIATPRRTPVLVVPSQGWPELLKAPVYSSTSSAAFGIPLSSTTWVSSIGSFDKKSFFST